MVQAQSYEAHHEQSAALQPNKFPIPSLRCLQFCFSGIWPKSKIRKEKSGFFFYQHTTPKKTYHQNTTNAKLLHLNTTAVQLAKIKNQLQFIFFKLYFITILTIFSFKLNKIFEIYGVILRKKKKK